VAGKAVSGTGMWGVMPTAVEPISPEAGFDALGEAYSVFVTGTELSTGRLEFILNDGVLGGLDASRCGIARQTDEGWQLLTAYLSGDKRSIWASIEDEGIYRLVWGQEITSTIALPREMTLTQNYPNPFNPETAIQFALPEGSRVTLDIYNLMGRRVIRLYDGYASAGYHTVHWNGLNAQGRPAASGVYFYRLSAGSRVMSKKMVLLR